jgi:hypothetical protein
MWREAAMATALLAACSADDDASPPGADAAVDAPEAERDAGPPAPQAPASPRLEPCPAGWAVVAGAVPTCTPYPGGAPDVCDDGEAHFPGTAGCAPIGGQCPAGDFAEIEADGVVWYVRAAEPPGGDGSLDAPFATIAEGLDAASSGDVVALSRGAFAEAVVLPRGVTLRGACAAETTIATDDPSGAAGVVTVYEEDTAIADVTLLGPGPGLWVEGRNAVTSVEGAVIAEADFVGILVGSGGTLTGRSIVVRDVHAQDVPGVSGIGLIADSRGAVELERVMIERTGGTGVIAAGTRIALRDAAIRDGLGEDPPARGVEVQLGGAVELGRAWMHGQRDVAILALDMDSEVVVEDAVIEATEWNVRGEGGRGLSLVDGARGTVRRARFADQGEVAVIADGAALELEDVLIEGARGNDTDGTGGSGVTAQYGATATMTRVHVADARSVGLLVISTGTTATIADVDVTGTRSHTGDGEMGTGIHVQGAALSGVRLRATGNHQAGLMAIADAAVDLQDLEIADTLERECAADACAGVGFGDGLISSLGSAVEVRRFRILRSARVGVTIVDGALDLHEGEVAGCPIGASVQTEGFDLQRLYDAVVFRDNDRNLDRSQIAVPEPAAEL